MYYQRLSDEEIMRGFRKGNEAIIREYFYGYCRVGYQIFDERYQLSGKENLDFMSLAHQYALYLMEHDWKPLEDHSPEVSLKTWLINGFRYVVLDALKWYRKEYGSITFVAKEHQNLTFLVTRIGCGIAGFTDDEISPLFEKAHDVENIVLPPGW